MDTQHTKTARIQMIKASNVDDYIAQSEWKKEVSMLRALILECSLEESVKWGAP